jgi:hypothetical protein
MPQIENMRTAIINAALVGANVILPALGTTGLNVGGVGVGSYTIWQVVLGGAGANTLQFTSGTNPIGPLITFTGAGAAATLQYTGAPWLKAAAGQALNLTLTTTAAVTGTIYFSLG